tara:strand:- start:1491 stop:1850 length:360 start_codon:yes stop_codon:yes gene_type:complete
MARNLSEEVRKALMENSDWGNLSLTLDEAVEVEDQEVEEVEDVEETLEEEAAEHICPLCTSELSEALDEDTLTEHLDVVLTLVDKLSAINEGEDVDMDALIEGALAEIFGSDEDEEDSE